MIDEKEIMEAGDVLTECNVNVLIQDFRHVIDEARNYVAAKAKWNSDKEEDEGDD